jgi:hypothetical protein
MAINTSGKPLRHVSTFTSSGNWVTPAGVTSVFVSINGASGGGGEEALVQLQVLWFK